MNRAMLIIGHANDSIGIKVIPAREQAAELKHTDGQDNVAVSEFFPLIGKIRHWVNFKHI
jgi:hypothetical protein